jgi:hypothetical protein
MAEKMEQLAPELWEMLGAVLSADRCQTRTKAGLSDELDGDQVTGNVGEANDTQFKDNQETKESALMDNVNIADASNLNFT